MGQIEWTSLTSDNYRNDYSARGLDDWIVLQSYMIGVNGMIIDCQGAPEGESFIVREAYQDHHYDLNVWLYLCKTANGSGTSLTGKAGGYCKGNFYVECVHWIAKTGGSIGKQSLPVFR